MGAKTLTKRSPVRAAPGSKAFALGHVKGVRYESTGDVAVPLSLQLHLKNVQLMIVVEDAEHTTYRYRLHDAELFSSDYSAEALV